MFYSYQLLSISSTTTESPVTERSRGAAFRQSQRPMSPRSLSPRSPSGVEVPSFGKLNHQSGTHRFEKVENISNLKIPFSQKSNLFYVDLKIQKPSETLGN